MKTVLHEENIWNTGQKKQKQKKKPEKFKIEVISQFMGGTVIKKEDFVTAQIIVALKNQHCEYKFYKVCKIWGTHFGLIP